MKFDLELGRYRDFEPRSSCYLGGGGGGGNTTTIQKSDPWEPAQQYLKKALSEADRLYGSGAGNQYDMDAYNKAMAAYNASGTGQLTQQQFQADPQLFNRYERNYAAYQAANPNRPQGPAPTLDQFALPGGQTSSNPLAPAYYPGKAIADLSPETLAAQNLTTQRALAGSSVQNQAKGLLGDTLAGNYLSPDSNPYLKANVDRALGDVTAKVNSTFGGAGRYGSGINQQVLARELGNTATQAYGQNYDAERNRQMQGLLFAPQMAASDYADLSALAGVGSAKDTYAQGLINEDINKYNYNANAPLTALQRYGQLVSGANAGGTTTNQTPYYGNAAGSALGTGLLGASLGSTYGASAAGLLGSQTPWLFGGPTGALIGGGLGLLGGLLS